MRLPADCNIHVIDYSSNLADMVSADTNMTAKDFVFIFNNRYNFLKSFVSDINVMLFNPSFGLSDVNHIIKELQYNNGLVKFTLLLDPAANPDFVESCCQSGVSAFKYHSYIQRIGSEFFDNIICQCKILNKYRKPIFIDTSYGGLDIYKYDNLKLAIHIINSGFNSPMVLLHAGGARVLEAMLIADASPNVYLDLSFSAPYFVGSSVFDDIGFAINKIGPGRVLFGSDFPYVKLEEAINSVNILFDKQGFQTNERNLIMHENFKRIFC